MDLDPSRWLASAAVRGGLLVLLGLGVGWLLSWLFGGGWRQEAARLRGQLEHERAEGEKALGRLRQELAGRVEQVQESGEVFQYLPEHVRELFVAAGPRAIGPAVLALIERLFHPAQAALFLARPSRRRLALAVGNGLPASLHPGAEVEYGRGRIGHAALVAASMDEADLKRAAASSAADHRHQLDQSGLPGLQAELVAPVREGETLLGVLVVAGVRRRKGREKALLGMVAELTAFALTHAMRLKASDESAQLDGLTGALGRKHYLARLEQEVRAADDAGTVFSVVLIDLDEFEAYNSMHGHHEGDEVLKRMAQVLRAGVRAEDVVARYGGEEFGLLLAGASKEVGLRVAETLRKAVAATPFEHAELQPGGRLTVSAGVATFPEDSKRGEQLLFCAEEALLHAKARGRNQVVGASPSFLS